MAAQWLQNYLQGSFRGVTFFINMAEGTGGRRNVTHLFPLVDDPKHEDMGRKVRPFNLSGYIIGDNYFNHREQLIKALDAKGPGRLVHPYRGIFQVVVNSFSESESTAEGRVARFNMQFEIDAVIQVSKSATNTATNVREKKISLLDRINGSFAEAYSIATTGKSLTDPTTVINPLSVTAVQDILKEINHGLDVISNAKKTVNVVAEYQRELANIQGKIIQLSLEGRDLADAIQEVLVFGTDPLGNIVKATTGNSMDQLIEMFNIVEDVTKPETETPPEVYDNVDYPAKKIQALRQQQAAAAAAGLVPVLPLSNITEAEDIRNKIFGILNTISEEATTSDLVYESIRDMKAAIAEDLDRRILDLARLVFFQLPETRPSLKVMNSIYGNLDKEEDFLKRNNIEHPGFVKGQRELQVEINV